MKHFLAVILASPIILASGCHKTNKVASTDAFLHPVATAIPLDSSVGQFDIQFDAELESDDERVVLMVNGEEKVVNLKKGMEFHDIGEEQMLLMLNDDRNPMRWIQESLGDNSDMEVEIIINGERVEDKFQDLPEHIMQKIADGENLDVQVYMTNENMSDMHEGMPPHMYMRDEHHGVHEFMQELGMLGDMSYRLSEYGAIAMLGINMIRNELDPEERVEALERIVEEAPRESPARNAALISLIETLQELSRKEEAIDLMVELVISNSHLNDD